MTLEFLSQDSPWSFLDLQIRDQNRKPVSGALVLAYGQEKAVLAEGRTDDLGKATLKIGLEPYNSVDLVIKGDNIEEHRSRRTTSKTDGFSTSVIDVVSVSTPIPIGPIVAIGALVLGIGAYHLMK